MCPITGAEGAEGARGEGAEGGQLAEEGNAATVTVEVRGPSPSSPEANCHSAGAVQHPCCCAGVPGGFGSCLLRFFDALTASACVPP